MLLGHPWTLKSRTVESLLLLSEWLPHIELTHGALKEDKSIFLEDRTSWSLVGLAVRQAYLMRLDQGAFPNTVMQQETKEQAEHKRLIWTCESRLTERSILPWLSLRIAFLSR